MNRELDVQCAKLLGWTGIQADCYTPTGKDWCGTNPERTGGWDGHGRTYIPHYSVRPEAARILEEEIERRGLKDTYINELIDACAGQAITMLDDLTFADLWSLIRATPEQRAQAFVTACRVG
jgi:hypothetical protein